MQKRLHEHLRTNLDFSPAEFDLKDLLEPLPDEYNDSQARVDKRRRVEKIATDYIRRGHMPVLVSSRLKGPFNAKWTNPWTEKERGEQNQHVSDPHRPEKQREKIRDVAITVTSVARCTLRRKQDKVHRLQSDETPVLRPVRRTAEKYHTVTESGESGGKEATDNTPLHVAGKLLNVGEDLPFRHDRKGPQRSSKSNKWLRRRPSDIGRRVSGGIGNAGTPSPPRDEAAVMDVSIRIERFTGPVSPPAAPTHGTPRQSLDPQWQSSASASMIISSPAHQAPFRAPDTLEESEPCTVQGGTGMHRNGGAGDDIRAPDEYAQSDAILNRESTKEDDTARSPSAIAPNHPSAKKAEARDACNRILSPKEMAYSKSANHKEPASPAQSSFQYTRVRKTAKTGPKAKPRPMTFESPPVSRDDVLEAGEMVARAINLPLGPQTAGMVGSGKSGSGQRRVRDIYSVPRDDDAPTEAPRGDGKMESQLSDFSTQTAMLKARREFQEGSFPSPLWSNASETPRAAQLVPFQPVQDGSRTDTPKMTVRDSSPAITPFHQFNAELEKRHPENDVAGALISTQDLFLAASPFAFSTVKKKPAAAPKRSSLRFAVLSQEAERDRMAETERGKSPTPSAERVPLKVRNSLVSFRSSPGKGSQESWKHYSPSRPRTSEFPQLDFATSTADLSFADQFLRNLDELT